ncbi:MAG: D-glycero-beta-D-manno-heptose 1,7-bisphosphate 7-phosphatase [Pseudomonadales bacterium]|jgi:D-glycero-D-manno-heptose 1,7-bisphosphate phosphatase|nr:D-glycero-beta-D-manno-heptose 1,7-bisphosphate 7-phosphatase [Pseudomonadales bacterium]
MGHLVILDRDGVINEDSASYVRSVTEWSPIPGSLEAIARLSSAGIRVAIATNQSGLARGLFDRATLDAIHDHMRTQVRAAGGEITYIAFCPHRPGDGCACRKPQPGLLQQIGRELGMSLRGVPFVGDSARDLEAAVAAGCDPVLVRTGKGRETERALTPMTAAVYDDLGAFTAAHLAKGSAGSASATAREAS